MHERELQACFSRPKVRVPLVGREHFIFPLPPLHPVTHTPEFIPLLTCEWDFDEDGSRPQRYFRLYMVPFEGNGHDGHEVPRRLWILRFEPHEANLPWGFSHVQSCDREDIYADWVGLDSRLVSPELPRIPLPGIRLDAPGLLVALITSLYGVGSNEFGIVADREVTMVSEAAHSLVSAFTA